MLLRYYLRFCIFPFFLLLLFKVVSRHSWYPSLEKPFYRFCQNSLIYYYQILYTKHHSKSYCTFYVAIVNVLLNLVEVLFIKLYFCCLTCLHLQLEPSHFQSSIYSMTWQFLFCILAYYFTSLFPFLTFFYLFFSYVPLAFWFRAPG